MTKEVKVALIGGTCAIIAAIIGVFSYDLNKSNKTLILENTELTEENNDWESAYNELQEDFNALSNKNTSLSSDIDSLKKSMEKYTDLVNENESLKDKISELEGEIKSLKKHDIQETAEENRTEEVIPNKSNKKISIFDLDTFKGYTPWSSPYNELYYTDTYGNEYVTAYNGAHHSKTKEDYEVPTYLLDNKYSICEGEIAWSKHDKNSEHSAWIEFYSGEDLIYTSDIITASDRAISFSFSVEGLETLTIVTNSTINTVYDNVYIIYPYLNLIEINKEGVSQNN